MSAPVKGIIIGSNGQPVAKISDAPSKTMDYDPSYVAYLREVFEVPEVPVPTAAET